MQFIQKIWGYTFLLCLLLSSSCLVMENSYSSLAPGYWRASLQLFPREITTTEKEDKKDQVVREVEEVTEGELPFVFELKYENETDFYIEIINGTERIRVDDITLTHDRATNVDSIFINFPIYGTYIAAAFQDHLIEGKWFVPYRGDNYAIPFSAKYGQDFRFTQLNKKPAIDLTGNWETAFDADKPDPYSAIGEFKQAGNHLSGTFRTETGDYRYLEGTVQGKKAYLSCFDGAHAFLFEAKLQEDESLVGTFRSGMHYRSVWEAKRNDDFVLGDADTLTYLKEGYDTVDFSFKNTSGKMVSINAPEYQNKIKIVQIFGTWCPNCRDETAFLVNYLKENPQDDLAVIGLAFERYREEEKAFAAINTYKEKFGIEYELLHGGYFDKKEAAEILPMLNHVLSYPTMIFIDRNNKVRRIHTGFSGPATSEYEEFTTTFKTFVDDLLKEKKTPNI